MAQQTGRAGRLHMAQTDRSRLAIPSLPCTHRLSVHRVHCEEQGSDKRQPSALEDHLLTGVHQHEGHQAVQDHIHRVEVERVHAGQKNVEPVRRYKAETEKSLQATGVEHKPSRPAIT